MGSRSRTRSTTSSSRTSIRTASRAIPPAACCRASQPGLMWTLANHPRVPAKVRQHFQTWGLARDEFVDNDNWPHQLYVREARRLISAYVMTEANCRRSRVAEDSVGLAAYNMDSH